REDELAEEAQTTTLGSVTVSLTRPLSLPRFRALWIASVFSNVGGFFQSVAASWLMLELTGSPVWVSAMAASTMLPLLFLALPSGALADLANRRNILLVTQATMLASVLGMTGFALSGHITPLLLLAFGLLLGVGAAFNAPVWMAMVPDLVPREMVPDAVALNSAAFNAARAIGPALGGIVVATAGPGVAFGINAASYVGVLGVILSFPASEWRPQEDSPMGKAIAAGVRYARFSPSLLWLLGVAAAFALTGASVLTLLPNLTRDSLGGGATMYGFLLGAMGVGALAGAFSRATATRGLGRRTVAASMALYGLGGVGIGLSGTPWLTGVLMAAVGVVWVWSLTTLNATIQTLSHSWVRGRALSLYILAFSGVWPLGALLAGGVANVIGSDHAVAALSAAAVVLGLAAFRMPIVGIDDVAAPEPPEDYDLMPHGDAELAGGPVLVLNTWTIDESRLGDYLEAMAELRRVRLRTGAFRWRLYRYFEEPHRMTEAFSLASWEEHQRQHHRIDAVDAEIIRWARSFDVADGPRAQHLVGFEVVDPRHRPDWEELVVHHRLAHEEDGSIPLAEG
ncbi:MAG TPA: MFS transporter, partial [Acidimicrobiia bacterium]|nr:MFS transporter [Acidimicrobiia bacterium]